MTDNSFEIYECAKWLQSTLEGDSTLNGVTNGSFMDMVPEDIDLPAIRYHVQAASTMRGLGPGHNAKILTTIDWLVVVMREGHEITPLVPIVMRLDTLLDGVTGSTSLVHINSCVNREPFQLLETDKSGVQVRHAGGVYRTIVLPT